MKNLYLAVIFLTVSTVNAQIGIGTSTIDASAKLQVDATNKGFLQPRVALTGTADTATIATPATGLMVFNTATAGNGATGVTPGVYYYSGSAWQRVANQADVAAANASTTTFVNGSLGTTWNATSGSYSAQMGRGANSFGASITLPPGKWEVVLDLTVNIQNYGTGVNEPALMNYWLDENSPSNTFFYDQIIPSTIGTSDAILSGSAAFVKPISFVNSNHKGSFYINNTTQANKTYNLYFMETVPYLSCQFDDCIHFEYKNFGGNGWPGNRLYAIKIN